MYHSTQFVTAQLSSDRINRIDMIIVLIEYIQHRPFVYEDIASKLNVECLREEISELILTLKDLHNGPDAISSGPPAIQRGFSSPQ